MKSNLEHHPGPFYSSRMYRVAFLLICVVSITRAEWETRSSCQILQGYFKNPEIQLLYPNTEDALSHLLFRQIAGYRNSNTEVHLNLYTELRHFSGVLAPGSFNSSAGESVYRYPELDWDFLKPDERSDLAGRGSIDQWYLRQSAGSVEMIFGRQPVNLQTCFYLSVNDFFTPFAPDAIDRIYRSGVDGITVHWYPSSLVEMSSIGVFGYENRTIRADRSAEIVRVCAVLSGTEYVLMAGQLSGRKVAAMSLQGEAGIAGLRLEANWSVPDDEQIDPYLQVSCGSDVRFSDQWHFFTEYLYWGNGARDPDDYLEQARSDGGESARFLGRHYGALGLNSQVHPLVVLSGLVLMNLMDRSGLASIRAAYSLSDNAEFLGGIQYSFGKTTRDAGRPDQMKPQSEYGMAASSLFAEVRFFF